MSCEKRWVPVAAAAEHFSIPQKTIYSLISRNRLPARAVLRIGRQIRLNVEAIEDELSDPKGRRS